MPYIEIETNVAVEDKSQVGKDFTPVAAGALGKSVNVFMVNVKTSEGLVFGGSADPCAIVNVRGVGGTIAPLLEPATSFLSQRLGVPQNRIFITYSAYDPMEWGLDGKTIAEIRAQNN